MGRLVASVGDANVDLLARVPAVPQRGEEVLIERVQRRAGGSAANFSAAVSRLGFGSGFLGRVGDDSFGRFLVEEFKKDGVEISQLQVDEEAATGFVLVLVTSEGERTMFGFRGANSRFSLEGVDPSYLGRLKALHISGYALLEGPQRVAAQKLLKLARREGILVSLDVGITPARRIAPRLRSILRFVDLLFLNELEASLLMGAKSPRLAAKLAHKAGAKTVVLKLGGKGCLVITPQAEGHHPSFPVKIKDTTGAGDAFDAGFVVGLIQGWDVEEAARFANAVGALSATKVGARTALPTARKVKAFLNRFSGGRR